MIPENVTADMETSPREDFYLYVNKDWILSGGKSPEWQQTSKEKLKEEILDLIENEDGSDIHETELLRDYYYAYTDWDARDKAGVEPLRPVVEDISSIGSLDELTSFLSDEKRSRDIVPAIKIDNTVTDKDPDHYVTLVHFEGFSSTLLEDPDAYNGTTKKGEATKAAAKNLVVYVLEGLGWTPEMLRADIKKVFDIYYRVFYGNSDVTAQENEFARQIREQITARARRI